ncbi:MAG TPA: hypothetical protein VN282_26520 [Pyrinomonadaceae bacterium]|nr:hypothetical protein [Pyrinomonadaceae bacterium]
MLLLLLKLLLESKGFRVAEAANGEEAVESARAPRWRWRGWRATHSSIGGFRAMGMVIGYACGGLAVALVIFSTLAAAKGGGEGMLPLLVGFGLLLAAVAVLRPSKTRL